MRIVKYRKSSDGPWQRGILHGFLASGGTTVTAIVEQIEGPNKSMCDTCAVTLETFGFEQGTEDFIREQQMARARMMGGPGGPIIPG